MPPAGVIAAVRAKGKKLWITVGHAVPKEGARLQAFHQWLACEPVDVILADRSDLLLAIERDRSAGKLSCPAGEGSATAGGAIAGRH
jgi:hypothetical protein